ncbi:MAG: precorrin-3B C(17)-methyltransferase, partial [Cellulosilyticaceae bacterium]
MIYVIGIGPGDRQMMTYEAVTAIEQCEVIVGYKTYVDLITELIAQKIVVSSGMRQEVERCQEAIRYAKQGLDVGVVSSGDSGVYGMAGLLLELVSQDSESIEVKIVPGITASIGAAAVLGAPLMHDACHISLSDLLTPWEVIARRLVAAAQADFVICLYNPRSKGREGHLKKAFELMAPFKNKSTPIGIVKDIGRANQAHWMTTYEEMDFEKVDMTTTVIIGNGATQKCGKWMVTPR